MTLEDDMKTIKENSVYIHVENDHKRRINTYFVDESEPELEETNFLSDPLPPQGYLMSLGVHFLFCFINKASIFTILRSIFNSL